VFAIIRGASVLLLLATFLAYVLIPIVEGIRRQVQRRLVRRPPRSGTVLLAIYCFAFGMLLIFWRGSAPRVRTVITQSAPAAIERLFGNSGTRLDSIENFMSDLPGPTPVRAALASAASGGSVYLEREVRSTFDELLAAFKYARWLAVVPLVTFLLMTGAPGFRRSAERLLPRGHLQWRAGEYFRDVNSALAGYVRAQLAAAVIVGVICSIGFSMLGLPYALAMGVAAGAVEMLPAIGPVAALLMATSQAEGSALGVVAFLGGLRLVQDYVIYPRLIRHGMHLSTPLVILSVWSGAVLGGAAGVLLALPVAGLLSVSLRHWQEYRAIERVVRDHARGAAG
jgi:predicted PurR-regulated permease PerM